MVWIGKLCDAIAEIIGARIGIESQWSESGGKLVKVIACIMQKASASPIQNGLFWKDIERGVYKLHWTSNTFIFPSFRLKVTQSVLW